MRMSAVLLLVSCLAFAVIGCGKAAEPAPQPSAQVPVAQPPAPEPPAAEPPAAEPAPAAPTAAPPAPVAPPDLDTSAKPEVNTDPGKPVFELACNKCHPQAKAEAYAGAEAWQAIVDRMITKHGAEIKPENATMIVEYLNKTFPRK